MVKRVAKQFVIGLVFLFILFCLGLLIYYFTRPDPSCFDGIQNQEEEEIDCGGPCVSCEFLTLEEIKILWAKALPGQGNFYDLAAQMRNPNQNYGSDRVPYQFELYDSSDNLVGQFSGSTFILPNQTKYLVRMKVESSGQVNRVKLSLGENEWQKLEDYQPPQLALQRKEYRLLGSGDIGFSQARAVLINKSIFDFDKVDIDVLLFDPSRHLITVGTTEIRTILSGQERDFVVTWFREISGQVSLVEMEAETNMFDPANYLPTAEREIEKFQEY